LRPHPRTSFHHQPEAQHPKSSAIHKIAGRLPHLSGGEADIDGFWRVLDLLRLTRCCHLVMNFAAMRDAGISAFPVFTALL
jgi:hypothetical protein